MRTSAYHTSFYKSFKSKVDFEPKSKESVSLMQSKTLLDSYVMKLCAVCPIAPREVPHRIIPIRFLVYVGVILKKLSKLLHSTSTKFHSARMSRADDLM